MQLEPVATLGLSGPAIRPIGQVTVDSQGNFYVAPTFDPGKIAMFSPDGEYMGSFGRQGEGPGEFGGLFNVLAVGPGDSIHVMETGRHTVIAPQLSEFISTRQLRVAPFDVVWPGDGSMVVYRMIQTRGRTGYALHTVDSNDEISRSFAVQDPWDRRKPQQEMRSLAAAANGKVWLAHSGQYRIERWTSDGTLDKVLEREEDWFPAWADVVEDISEIDHYPRILDIHEPEDGRLMVIILVPDASRDRSSPQSEANLEAIDFNRVHDTIVEVLDIDTGEVLARGRFADAFSGFIGDTNLVRTQRTRDDGLILFDVWRVLVAP